MSAPEEEWCVGFGPLKLAFDLWLLGCLRLCVSTGGWLSSIFDGVRGSLAEIDKSQRLRKPSRLQTTVKRTATTWARQQVLRS